MLAPKGWTCRKVEMIPEDEQSNIVVSTDTEDASRFSNCDIQQEDLLLLSF